MGHFARVLVELDLKHDKEEYVMFKRAGHRSVVYIQYECLPEYCNYCNVIGHSTDNCSTSYHSKQGKDKQAPSEAPKVVAKPDYPTGGTKQWVQCTFVEPRTKDKIDTLAAPNVLCSNSFRALSEEGLDDAHPVLAEPRNSVPGPESSSATCTREGFLNIQGLEVHLPPIEGPLEAGGSPNNTTNG
ncbi:hypothetical protein ACS0TY_029985 [Phlomoides rotata]